MILPRQVLVSETCVCIDTLGKVELEAIAAIIVLYHWEHSPDAWMQITRRQIAEWIPTSTALAKMVSNPFWKPDIKGFCDGGYVDGWEIDGIEGADIPGTFTQKFFDALEKGAKINFTG